MQINFFNYVISDTRRYKCAIFLSSLLVYVRFINRLKVPGFLLKGELWGRFNIWISHLLIADYILNIVITWGCERLFLIIVIELAASQRVSAFRSNSIIFWASYSSNLFEFSLTLCCFASWSHLLTISYIITSIGYRHLLIVRVKGYSFLAIIDSIKRIERDTATHNWALPIINLSRILLDVVPGGGKPHVCDEFSRVSQLFARSEIWSLSLKS